jgi:hypothetical protein
MCPYLLGFESFETKELMSVTSVSKLGSNSWFYLSQGDFITMYSDFSGNVFDVMIFYRELIG